MPVFTDNRSHFSAPVTDLAERAISCFLGLQIATRTVGGAAAIRPLPVDSRLTQASDGSVEVAPYVYARLSGVRQHLIRLSTVGPYSVQSERPDGSPVDERALAEELLHQHGRGTVHIVAHCRIPADRLRAQESTLVFRPTGFRRPEFTCRWHC